jgi:hypothetical protein
MMLPRITSTFINLKTKRSNERDFGISYKNNFLVLLPILGKVDYEFLLEVKLFFSSITVGDSVLCLRIHDPIAPVPISKGLRSDYEFFFTLTFEDGTALWQ